MSGSGANLPVTIQVQGQQQAEAAFNTVAATGERAMQRLNTATTQATTGTRNFGGAIGQAGYQIQDFAVQVQGGVSWMTALSQQGSQFLGAFGVGGAIAGAVLTVGLLAAQFLTGAQNAEELRKVAEEGFKNTGKAAEELRDVLKEINGLYGTQAEQAARATNATRDLLAERLRVQENNAHLFLEDSAGMIATATRDRDAAARNLARLEAQAARGGVTVQPGDIAAARGRLFEDEARLAGLRQDIERQQAALGRIADGRARLANAGRVTGDGDEYGPPTPPGFGARRGSTGPDAITRMVRDNVMREHEREFAQAKRDMSLLGDETQRTRDITRDLGMTFTSAFEDAIVRGKSFRDVLAGIAEDIGRIVLRQTVTAPLAGALSSVVGNLFSPGGGSFSTGKFFGGGWLGGGGAKGAADAALAGAFSYGGARAAGGPVDPSSFYMVGERGPEWFVPNTSGNIVPNGAMGGTTLVMNINAQGAGPREIDALRMQIPALARAAVEDAARRGGASARNIRGR